MLKKLFSILSLILIFTIVSCQVKDDIDNPVTLKFQLTFMLDETTIYKTFEVEIGQPMIYPEDPSLDDHIFIGWYANLEEFSGDKVVPEALTLYAKFQPIQTTIEYKVTFKDENSTLLETAVLKGDTLKDYLPSTTRQHYQFKGWFIDDKFTIAVDPNNYEILEDTILYGKWEANDYIVTFYNGNAIYATVRVTYDKALDLPDTDREGYEFDGWFTDSALTKPFNASTIITQNTALYGKWTYIQSGGGTEFTGYYASLSGLSGKALVDELYKILNDTGQYPTTTYGQARYYLEETDRWVTYNPDYLYLIYTDTLRTSKNSGFQFDGYALPKWDANNDGAQSTWNREHVWAKSLFGTGSYDPKDNTRGIDADLHNLRAADTNVNSTRGNNLFINQVYVAEGFGNYGSKWYPGDHHRGDVARIIFYMDIRWGSLTNISKIGDLQTFIEWHKADPVDEFEIYRNNKIYEYQHNRNPFIDHPELVDMIYGN